MDRRPAQLLAYFSDDFDDVSAVGDLAVDLVAMGEWTVAPPAFVDETDDGSRTQPEDEPIRTVGLVLPLTYDGGPTAPVRDLTAFVGALAEFSRARDVEFEIERRRISWCCSGRRRRWRITTPWWRSRSS